MLFVVFSCFNLLQAYKLSNSFFFFFLYLLFHKFLTILKKTHTSSNICWSWLWIAWLVVQTTTNSWFPLSSLHFISFPSYDLSSNHLFRSFLLIHSFQKESYRSKGCHHRSLAFSFSNISEFSGLYVLKSLSNRVTLFFFFVLYQQYYLHMPMPMPMAMQTMIECIWLSLSTFLLCFACDAFMYCSPCKIHLLE